MKILSVAFLSMFTFPLFAATLSCTLSTFHTGQGQTDLKFREVLKLRDNQVGGMDVRAKITYKNKNVSFTADGFENKNSGKIGYSTVLNLTDESNGASSRTIGFGEYAAANVSFSSADGGSNYFLSCTVQKQ